MTIPGHSWAQCAQEGCWAEIRLQFLVTRVGNTARPHLCQRDASYRTFQSVQTTGSKVYSDLQSMVDWLGEKKKKKKSPKLGNMGDTLIEEKNRTKGIFPPNHFKGPCFECPEAGALGWPRGMGWGGRWEGGSGWGHTYIHVLLCQCMAKTTTIL